MNRNAQDYTSTIRVAAPARDAFDAINHVGNWWSASFEGSNRQLADVFTVCFGNVFVTLKVVELIPDRKIAWLVTDCNKPWLKNTKEWNGTIMSWRLREEDGKTRIHFTHVGLVPEIECFDVCSDAWSQYMQSLERLITTGKGAPYAIESTKAAV